MFWLFSRNLALTLTLVLALCCRQGEGGVVAPLEAPTSLEYSVSPALYTCGSPIVPNLPSIRGGAATSFTLSPNLPAGLILDSKTGVISGTPLVATAANAYYVTASNRSGTTTIALLITVTDPPPLYPVVTLSEFVTSGQSGLMASTQDQGKGIAYNWTLKGGTVTSGQGTTSILFTAAQSGDVLASVIATNTGGSTSGSAKATIVAIPDPSITCPLLVHPGDGWMAASVIDQPGMIYSWAVTPKTSGGTIISGQGSSQITLVASDDAGVFQVNVNIQNKAGTVATSSEFITVTAGIWLVENGGQSVAGLSPRIIQLLNNWVLVTGGGNGLGGARLQSFLCNPTTGQWLPTGNLGVARCYHTATMLNNGNVLVTGGVPSWDSPAEAFSSTEIFQPTTGIWSPSAGMSVRRSSHTATLLSDGTVLVTGGINPIGSITSNTEIYSPATDSWTPTGNLGTPRSNHTATLLQSGKILVTGGDGGGVTCEIYDPLFGTWTPTGSLSKARSNHSALLLNDGSILVTGGRAASEAEIYDTISGTWALAGNMGSARSNHSVTLLPTGLVLVAGGVDDQNQPQSSVQIFNKSTVSWTSGSSMNSIRSNHTAILLPDGHVFVLGGSLYAGSEKYRPWLEDSASYRVYAIFYN